MKPETSTNRKRESGQTTIFFAVMAAAIFGIVGLAVGGGKLFVEYRHMQAATDMAAVIGAQDLPCNNQANSCDTAQTDACDAAMSNGYPDSSHQGNCNSKEAPVPGLDQSGPQVWAYVPPSSCSPYDFINYGNGNSCAQTPATLYYYAEVQIKKTVTVPFMNVLASLLGLPPINITLYTHAVARNGTPSPKDYAIAVLDPSMSGALSFQQNSHNPITIVGSVIADSSSASSITSGNNSAEVTCDGGWFAASNSTAQTGLTSNSAGQPSFSPPGCSGGSTDSPIRYFPNAGAIPDPYAMVNMPSGGTNLQNCTPCQNNAWVYTWSSNRYSGTWQQVSGNLTINGNAELFPGIYPAGLSISSGNTIFLNPGVYTVQGTFKVTGGRICVYGAPVCDMMVSGTTIPGTTPSSGIGCSNASFNNGDSTYVSSDIWYYYCSPWGIFDTVIASKSSAPAAAQSALGTAPKFCLEDYTAQTCNGSTPINGVTFYEQNGNFDMEGSGSIYMAFPNACPGTGTGSVPNSGGASGGTATFTANPIGETSGAPANSVPYKYPSTDYTYQDLNSAGLATNSGATAMIYPNMDFTLQGECGDYQTSTYVGDTWYNEFPSGYAKQHLQFLVLANKCAACQFKLAGSGLQNFYGVLYNAGNSATGGGCGNACAIQISGGAGSSTGPPFLTGQIVSDNVAFSGNSTIVVYYRPCNQGPTPCGSGPGTSLVE